MSLALNVAALSLLMVVGVGIASGQAFNFIGLKASGSDGNLFETISVDKVADMCETAKQIQEKPEPDNFNGRLNKVEISVTGDGEEPDPNVIKASGSNINRQETISGCRLAIEAGEEKSEVIGTGSWSFTVKCAEACKGRNEKAPLIKIVAEKT